MNRYHVALLALSFTITACGGSGSREASSGLGSAAGAGGESAAGGAASSAQPSTCQQGETRSCLGPGACDGAQMCTVAGVWGSCDCGVEPTGGAGGQPSGPDVGCEPGLVLCDGFCTDLRAVENCGTCGNTCGQNEICNAGTCECGSGFTDCGEFAWYDAERCADLNTSQAHCGACQVYCWGNCVDGTCEDPL